MQIDWNLVLSAATLLTAIIAFCTYKANIKAQKEERFRNADKELIHQTALSFEWAYAALVGIDGQSHLKPNRLNWLTCARHLLRQEEIAKEIVGTVYKTIYEETKDYWRHQFYLALQNTVKSTDYFITDQTLSIEPTSAFVIINFSIWPEDKEDPTNRFTPESIAGELDFMDYPPISPMGHFERYLRALPEYKEFFINENDDDSNK